MNHHWLVLRLEAPLMAFGGIAVDQVRPIRDFPAASMITGLIGNALGWHWCDGAQHQVLQDRLVFAAYKQREGFLLTDMQNAELNSRDTAWTTRAAPEQRTGGWRTYASPHRRRREYLADEAVGVVLRLEQINVPPTIEALAHAFDCPARPLFVGRKTCLPSRPLVAPESERWVEAPNAYAALCAVAADQSSSARRRALWPVGEGPERGAHVDRLVERADLRKWRTGLHSGSRRVVEGWVP